MREIPRLATYDVSHLICRKATAWQRVPRSREVSHAARRASAIVAGRGRPGGDAAAGPAARKETQ